MSVRSLAPGLTTRLRMKSMELFGAALRAPRPQRARFSTLAASARAHPAKIAVIYYSTYGEDHMPLLGCWDGWTWHPVHDLASGVPLCRLSSACDSYGPAALHSLFCE